MFLDVTETLHCLEQLFTEKFQLLSVFASLHDENTKKISVNKFSWHKLVCIFLLIANNLLDAM